MKRHLYFYLLSIVSLVFSSCGDDEGPTSPAGEYASGVFVVNEGNFGGGNASISHFDLENGTVSKGMFSSVNGGALGDVAQSMSLSGEEAYIILNNSTKVEIVNYGTFESTGTITDGLANPRYLAVDGDRAFISNWGNFDENFQLDQSFIGVVDLADNSLSTKINTNDGVEHIFIFEGKLFVANSFTNTVQAFDMDSYELLGTTELAQSPGQFAVDADENLWVISQGNFAGNDGALTCINTTNFSIERRVNLGLNPANKLVPNDASNLLYFYQGNTIYQFSSRGTDPSILAEMTDFVGIYGIGYHEDDELIYVSDAVGFGGEGKVVRLTVDGVEVDEFGAGIGPNSFVFTP
ncbi:MAG: hypothetical protein RIF33_19845 [Cyclobacteriaceae bacterium]